MADEDDDLPRKSRRKRPSQPALNGDGSPPVRRPDGKFAPGYSGRPQGRTKGARGMIQLFNEKSAEKVAVKVDGQVVRMSRLEAWVTNLWNKAIATDPRASATVLSILRVSGQLDPVLDDDNALGPDDEAVLAALLKRIGMPKEEGGEGDH